MIVYIIIRAATSPSQAPRTAEQFTWPDRLRALGRVAPALVLIALVLGSIYSGLATPTEAAALGALAAFVVTGLVYRNLTPSALKTIFESTAKVSASILIIVGAAYVFTQMLVLARVPDTVSNFVVELDVSRYVVICLLYTSPSPRDS